MIIMPTFQCRPGMKLGRSVYSEQGQVLVKRGFVLSEHVIVRLHKMGHPFLHVEEEGTEDISPDQAVGEEAMNVLRGAVVQAINELNDGKRTSLSPETVRFCSDAVSLLIKGMDRRNRLILPIHDYAVFSDERRQRFLENAVNVGVCVTRLAMEEGLHGEELAALAAGAIFHDIGLFRSGRDGKNRAHTEEGYRLLKDSGFSELTAHCALFHHERMNGSGYPFGLAGARLPDNIQWVGLIDEFDGLIHGRNKGCPMLPHEALEVLYGGAGTLYDIDKVRRLRDKLALFPVGTTVRLNTGEIGVVSRLHEDSKQRPVVRIIRGARGEPVARPFEVDLKRCLHVMIGELDRQSFSEDNFGIPSPAKKLIKNA
ncbi:MULTISPECIES: HD-GYP domain-containing protein [Cohnella]|uniref:HD-GYP domain-containing protein n=1 Tax=Cohnella TaxID=329857 RepID=UPI0009B9392F|nr:MULTISPECIES: HD domain-containing phosphohydrolase [Cohnella]MBN2981931.1 HD domain-containing protein [Cohnella algarum]